MTESRLTVGRHPTPGESAIQIADWGFLPYRDAHHRQLAALEERLDERIGDTVFLVEHPHVYTYGRGSESFTTDAPAQVFGQPVDRVAIERGGDVTYHGPGQLVAYPIVDVKTLTGDLHLFLHWLEKAIIRTIARWGISGEHRPNHTGVWVGNRKIASIGVAVRRWIYYHGLALNVSTDLRYFSAVRPCGLSPDVMTSMEQQIQGRISLGSVKNALTAAFRFPEPHAQ
jgi:lipoate-protein ligase B